MSTNIIQSMSGGQNGYFVEARYNYPAPLPLSNGFILSKEWRRVPFARAREGVPTTGYPPELLVICGLHSYEQAEALRWSLMAEVSADHKLCLETRLVHCEVKYDIKAERKNAYEKQEIGRGPNSLELHVEDTPK